MALTGHHLILVLVCCQLYLLVPTNSRHTPLQVKYRLKRSAFTPPTVTSMRSPTRTRQGTHTRYIKHASASLTPQMGWMPSSRGSSSQSTRHIQISPKTRHFRVSHSSSSSPVVVAVAAPTRGRSSTKSSSTSVSYSRAETNSRIPSDSWQAGNQQSPNSDPRLSSSIGESKRNHIPPEPTKITSTPDSTEKHDRHPKTRYHTERFSDPSPPTVDGTSETTRRHVVEHRRDHVKATEPFDEPQRRKNLEGAGTITEDKTTGSNEEPDRVVPQISNQRHVEDEKIQKRNHRLDVFGHTIAEDLSHLSSGTDQHATSESTSSHHQIEVASPTEPQRNVPKYNEEDIAQKRAYIQGLLQSDDMSTTIFDDVSTNSKSEYQSPRSRGSEVSSPMIAAQRKSSTEEGFVQDETTVNTVKMNEVLVAVDASFKTLFDMLKRNITMQHFLNRMNSGASLDELLSMLQFTPTTTKSPDPIQEPTPESTQHKKEKRLKEAIKTSTLDEGIHESPSETESIETNLVYHHTRKSKKQHSNEETHHSGRQKERSRDSSKQGRHSRKHSSSNSKRKLANKPNLKEEHQKNRKNKQASILSISVHEKFPTTHTEDLTEDTKDTHETTIPEHFDQIHPVQKSSLPETRDHKLQVQQDAQQNPLEDNKTKRGLVDLPQKTDISTSTDVRSSSQILQDKQPIKRPSLPTNGILIICAVLAGLTFVILLVLFTYGLVRCTTPTSKAMAKARAQKLEEKQRQQQQQQQQEPFE